MYNVPKYTLLRNNKHKLNRYDFVYYDVYTIYYYNIILTNIMAIIICLLPKDL